MKPREARPKEDYMTNIRDVNVEVSISGGTPNGWFEMENPTKIG